MRVTVLRGPESQLLPRCAQMARGLESLYFTQTDIPLRSWGAVRSILAQLRRRLDASCYQDILCRHAAVASLLLPRDEESTDHVRRAADALAAQPTSHMTHNLVLQHPIAEAVAAVLVDLMDRVRMANATEPLLLVVPSLDLLSLDDASALKAIYRRHSARAPHLVLGFDPKLNREPDERGIVWSILPYYLCKLVADFQLIPGSETLHLTAEVDPQADRQNLLQQLRDVREDFDHLEARAWQALADEKDRQDLTAPTVALVVAALRASFRSFGFNSTLRLGLELLSHRPGLCARDAADVHTLIALSGHNRQFTTQGNRTLARFLAEHLAAALSFEDRPARRAALLYRLAVMHGRRLKDFDASLEFANQAITLAEQDLPPREAVYQGAWTRNIRAYVLMRTGCFQAAEQDTMAAFDLVDRHLGAIVDPAALEGSEKMWLRDLRSTASLLAHNTRGLLLMLKRPAADLLPWLQRAHTAIADIPSLERFETVAWTDQFLRETRPDLALEATLRGMADAQHERDAVREYDHVMMAAHLHFRLGRPVEAQEAFEQVQALRARCHLPRLLAADVLSALSLAHGGRLEEARARLRSLLDGELPEGDVRSRAEILAHLIGILARLNLYSETEQAIEEAIELAKATGDRNLLLQVAVAAGRGCQILKLDEWAREAYEQALDIAAAGGPDAAPPPPAHLLAALLGRHETGASDPAVVLRAVRCARTALKASEPWWDLPRLLASLATVPPDLLRNEEAALEEILQAAQVRSDCARFFHPLPVFVRQSRRHASAASQRV